MKIFSLLLLALVIFNILTFHNIYNITVIYCFFFLLILPGYLILKFLNYQYDSKFEYFLFICGISLSFLLFFGLSINYLLPLFNITTPLSKSSFVFSFDILYLISSVIFSLRVKKVGDSKTTFKISNFVYLIPFIFPILSVLGVISLNNNGTNAITLFMLGSIGIYLIVLVLLKEKAYKVFPLSLYMIALSVLLMLSLRSWYISGSGNDINIEYQVFQITKAHNFWSIDDFKSAYNACLSITILPTILANVLNINDQYIYKLLYQIIFALTPVSIYFIVKNKTTPIIGFFSAVFFISQPWFIDPMVAINRQEIAFLFFALTLVVLLHTNLKHNIKSLLFLIFSFSIVLSHYSTTYVTIILFTSTYILFNLLNSKIISKLKLFNKIINFTNLGEYRIMHDFAFLSGRYILFFIIFSFLWYSQLTPTSNNVFSFIYKTVSNFQNMTSQDSKSELVTQIFNPSADVNSENAYQNYVDSSTQTYAQTEKNNLYPSNTYKDFVMIPKAPKTLEVKNTLLYMITSNFYIASLFLIQLCFLLGTFYIFFVRTKFTINRQYIYLILISELLLFSMIVLPEVSQDYNFDRLYLQIMIYSSIAEVLGGFFILSKFNDHVRNNIFNLLLVFTFLFTYGFIWQFVGGKTVLWLNNFGAYYDYQYTHKSEVASINWLAKRVNSNAQIITDINGRNKLWAFGNFNNVVSSVVPQTIATYSYVYLTYSNVQNDIAYFPYNGVYLGYIYPANFLNDNKNLIYNNEGSKIYK